MLRIEISLGIAAILWGFAFPRFGSRWFERIESNFSRLAQRWTLSVVVVGILAIIARLAVLPVLPIPSPAIHDEFSYLLMADTFAHGRLANPTHPMWIHFETFHVNQVPTYVSKYFPAQGIFLAIGQVVFGHPFWGVVLSSGLMCAAICWMLQGWMPPAWALLGGLLAVIRLGTFSYWANSYWGGAVTALGGALVLGALPRIKDKQRVGDAIWMGVGLALLFNSRPYESLFLAVPVAIALLVWLLKKRGQEIRRGAVCVIVPLGIILTVTLAGMGFYFWKTTGDPLRPPYVVNESTYSIVPLFPWMPLKPMPSYSTPAMRSFLRWKLAQSVQFSCTASIVKHMPEDFRLLAFLPRADVNYPVSGVATSRALRGKAFRHFGAYAISPACGQRFIRRNGVAGLFPGALRRADCGPHLPICFVRHEISPSMALWGEARGSGNHEGGRCLLRLACICPHRRYRYSYSSLIMIFSILMRDGWLTEADLVGLQEDKIARIKLGASLEASEARSTLD